MDGKPTMGQKEVEGPALGGSEFGLSSSNSPHPTWVQTVQLPLLRALGGHRSQAQLIRGGHTLHQSNWLMMATVTDLVQ